MSSIINFLDQYLGKLSRDVSVIASTARVKSQSPEHATVLLVEDEAVLLETVGECLRDWGYRVLEAPNAAGAIEQLGVSAHVDLVFSDVSMPGRIDGFGLARWVRSHYPAMRILLTTGYEGPCSEPTDELHDGPILRKPYDLRTLQRRLEDLIFRTKM